jgi:hypothetical protein
MIELSSSPPCDAPELLLVGGKAATEEIEAAVVLRFVATSLELGAARVL